MAPVWAMLIVTCMQALIATAPKNEFLPPFLVHPFAKFVPSVEGKQDIVSDSRILDQGLRFDPITAGQYSGQFRFPYCVFGELARNPIGDCFVSEDGQAKALPVLRIRPVSWGRFTLTVQLPNDFARCPKAGNCQINERIVPCGQAGFKRFAGSFEGLRLKVCAARLEFLVNNGWRSHQ